MAKKQVDTPNRDELAEILYDSLNKAGKVAYFLGAEESPTDLDDWVSTGCTTLDIAISNRPHGGLPAGRIVEFIGKEGSGKSLIAAHILANTQKAGGVGVLIDTEAAVNEEFYEAVGCDFSSLVYVHTVVLEDIYDIIVQIVEKVRATDKDKLVTIVFDSQSGSSPAKELESDFSKDGYATEKAIIHSKAMRKITSMLATQKILLIITSQIRDKMNAMPFAQQWTTSGGKSIAFHSSLRLFLQPAGNIKNGKDGNVIGIKVKGKVIKNRFGPPQRVADFDIFFDRGIDDHGAMLKSLVQLKLIKQGGAWYTFVDENEQEIKFQSKDFQEFLEADPERKEALYQKFCESYIMSYVKSDEEVEVDFLEIME